LCWKLHNELLITLVWSSATYGKLQRKRHSTGFKNSIRIRDRPRIGKTTCVWRNIELMDRTWKDDDIFSGIFAYHIYVSYSFRFVKSPPTPAADTAAAADGIVRANNMRCHVIAARSRDPERPLPGV